MHVREQGTAAAYLAALLRARDALTAQVIEARGLSLPPGGEHAHHLGPLRAGAPSLDAYAVASVISEAGACFAAIPL